MRQRRKKGLTNASMYIIIASMTQGSAKFPPAEEVRAVEEVSPDIQEIRDRIAALEDAIQGQQREDYAEALLNKRTRDFNNSLRKAIVSAKDCSAYLNHIVDILTGMENNL